MKYLDYPFRVSTRSGRRPTPSAFAHIHNYAELIEQFLRLSSQADMYNVEQLLDLVGNLYVSNKISRVIAQIIGHTDKGWITIEGTDAGALHVYVTNSSETKSARISYNTSGYHYVIPAALGKAICIDTIVFTVAGEVLIFLNTTSGGLTGVMNFGGTGQPMGMTINHGDHPLKAPKGEAVQFYTSANVQVSGWITYHEE